MDDFQGNSWKQSGILPGGHARFYNACMASQPDICIQGAGIVGRSLALLLARERLRVRLVQAPSPANGVDVRAYSLNSSAKQLLEDLRCWPASPAVTPVRAMQVFGDENGELNFLASEQGCDELNWMVDVPALEEQLAAAVRFQPLIEVADTPAPAPLTVICEGRSSQTRAELGVSFDVQHYPQHAVAARLQCELPHQGTARQWFRFGATPGLQTPQAEILALLPLGGEGAHEVALVWSVHPARAAELTALDAGAFAYELEQACGLSLGHMQLSSERAVWPLQLARASRWIGHLPGTSEQAFALAGDAAHAMHPLAGQGLNVGLGDVAELVKVIREKEFWRPLNDMKLLRRYERARQADVLAMGRLTDGLQRLFAHPHPTVQLLRNRGMQGFDRFAPLKRWMTRHAMGLPH
jgi:2-polyprenyl-6-methoxyphenol hydroxylase-like FAD-dependent oxidoreductase